MKKISFFVILVILISIIGLIHYAVYSLRHSPVGPPDSFIQTDKECVIQKNVFGDKLNDVFEITCGIQQYFIANSSVDLTKYIGKKVRIEANYQKDKYNDSIQTDKQCIAGKCQLIFKDGRIFYAINILNIEEVK